MLFIPQKRGGKGGELMGIGTAIAFETSERPRREGRPLKDS